MYLKLLKKVGDFEIECFTSEESQTIQELLFILDTLPIWANIKKAQKDTRNYGADKYISSVECSSAGYNATIDGSEYAKLFQKKNERTILKDGIILGIEIYDNDSRAFYVKSTKNYDYLFFAKQEKQNTITVLTFHNGNWANYLCYAFTQISSGQNATAILRKSPPWNFQPF